MEMQNLVKSESVERHLTHWPQILLETAQRSEGLILLSGTRHSQILNIEPTLRELFPNKRIVRTEKLHRQMRVKEIDASDIIIYHGICDRESTLAILDLCEEGRLVIQVVMAPTVMSSLHKVMTAVADSSMSHILWRYVDQMSLILNQMPIHDVNDQETFIHEIVLGTPTVKNLILENKLSEIEGLLRSHLENQGILSFNQSLLKLLIRRKIDMKTAFLKTRDPENLDELLKKVGI